MKRFLNHANRLLHCTSLALVTCFAVAAQIAATPVLPNADPFITLHPVQGKYLLLATTGRNITLWSGPSIANVASEAHVVFTPTDGLEQLWSPTIWSNGDRWVIYFTARMPGREHAIYVLESTTSDALGPYSFRGSLDLGRPAIDPSVLTLDGVRYLMYVTVDQGENAIRIQRLDKTMRPAGVSALIAEPEYAWERGAGSTKNYPVDEGPTALYHAGKTYIVFSGSDTASPIYCLGLLTLTGKDPMKRENWTKSPQPVFSANPAQGVFGPGRGTFAQAKDGQYWLLYAAKATDEPSAAHRETWAQPFSWKADGSPDFGVPMRKSSARSK